MSSLLGRRRYCVFGCAELGAYMHSFPHPDRRAEMFKKWVSVVGLKLKEEIPMKIYKNKKICDHHFTSDQKVASHRLKVSAVPTIHLDGIMASPNISIQLEHNYCVPGLPGISTCDRSVEPINEGLVAVQPLCDRLEQPSTSHIPAIKDQKSSEHLIKMYRSKQKETRKLKSQLRKAKKCELNYKSRLAALKNALTDRSALKSVTKNMTMAAKIFTGMQYRHALKKPKGRRYNIEEKVMALSIYKKSPKGYSLFSKYFKLPSAKSLKNLLREIKIGPGINKTIFEKINETVEGFSPENRLCTLIFDEMSLEPQVQYESTNDRFKGFISHNDDMKIANHVLVFMVKGIKMNFKQPVAYYFTQSLKTIELKNILKEIIRHVHKTKLRILCTVCDQGASNVSAINSLVADTKEIFLRKGKEWRNEVFSVDGKQIVPLYDVPHLLKGLRNNLLEKDLKYVDHKDENKEKTVKWQYFEMLYEADKLCGELRCLHKLTEEHVYKNKIKKMRVKMAAQLFSHSVAVTADHLTARQLLPEECRVIIPMVLLIDKLFDSLNAGTFHIPNGKVYRGAVKQNSPHHQLWKEAIQFLKSVKFLKKKTEGCKTRLIETSAPSIKNFIKTIEGMQALWVILNKKYSVDCMLTRNFNQDPVENFFGNIRSLGVRNVSPNCQAFEGAFKTILLNNYSCRQAVNANCEEDFNACLQSFQFLLTENRKIEKETKSKENITISQQLLETLSTGTRAHEGDTQKQYVCGWVLSKCLKTIVKGCKKCRETIISTNIENKDNAYIQAKEYQIKKKWLCYPSDQLARSFKDVQEIITTFLKTNLQKTGSKEHIKYLTNSFVSFPFYCEVHKEALQDYFVETIINIIIFSWCRSINRILSGKMTYQDADDPIKQVAQQYYSTHKHKK